MALGDGVRRNIAHVSAEERERFRDAVVKLNNQKYPDGVSKWVKQDHIHEATHVHGGPAFVPWHRELCNRFELLLREVDAELSLHYWDWTEDPRETRDSTDGKVNLFTEDFMGTDQNRVWTPFAKFPPTNTGITRHVAGGRNAPEPPPTDTDLEIINSTFGYPQEEQWKIFRERLEGNGVRNHDGVHRYIGGSIADPGTAFEDPFVFLLHSNVDRLWAMWQLVPGEEWRLDPDMIYGHEGHHPNIIAALEPWAGRHEKPLRPWGPPEYQNVIKNSKDLTIVVPPRYDTTLVLTYTRTSGDSSDPNTHPGSH